MPRIRKSWREKLADDKGLPRVGIITSGMRLCWGAKVGDRMLIPAPREVDALMRRVPAGKLATINDLRAALAKKHHAQITCPITTGIFAWIAAHAADEALADESIKPSAMTPYWRTLKNQGELNPKYPGGIPAIAKKLRAEGHKITRKGKRLFVANFEKSLAHLP